MKELFIAALILFPILYVVDVLPFDVAFEITRWTMMAMVTIGYLFVWYLAITMHRKECTDAQDNVQNENVAH